MRKMVNVVFRCPQKKQLLIGVCLHFPCAVEFLQNLNFLRNCIKDLNLALTVKQSLRLTTRFDR